MDRYLPILTLAVSLLAPRVQAAEHVDFNRDVRPILANNCFKCHGPDAKERKAELRLDTEEGATADLGDSRAVVHGKPQESELVRRITAKGHKQMPPRKSGKQLTPRDIEVLTAWVREGGHYARHWAYVKPVRPALSRVLNRAWTRNGIDFFILARLEAEGLQPAPEADRATLARRAALDLTGLPPAADEVERFVNDPRPDAYERFVDRLLASPRFGEHWARLWLDLARYADSAGYADDPLRTIWAYRDYVIRSFNTNKPFDRFTIEQIAGDLLPHPTEEQLIATAFHRNTMTNNEGGTSDEEFRNVAVVDRVNTTMAVWMGTSMACAQCHSHKYDPISQEEYFRFFAILNQTEDADRTDEAPVLKLLTPAQKQRRPWWEAQIWELEQIAQGTDPAVLAAKERLLVLQGDLKPATTVPIMHELTGAERRKTHVQYRGNYLDLGPEVHEGVPAAFQPLPRGLPPGRLALARWLVDADNPLTARVIANRFWEQIFGIGLVRTSEEFGTQGELPSHPELLDWLATELVRRGWDVKAFLKLLVTSASYRQSSRVTHALREHDPDNRLLARGPRFRLSAEVVRDQALAVSGLLSGKLYGPPVRPPRPATGLTAAFGGAIDWKTSDGTDRHRRGLYTEWRRSNPYPSMVTFDAPNREVCTLRRARTNTPLQALVVLNDPVYVEAAQALARRMVAGGANPTDRARRGFQLCLARPPSQQELERLVRLHDDVRASFEKSPDKARQLASDPLGPPPPGTDVAELASWTVVANILLNLDETLMRR
jgi:mono/diheme cytochrome c family protein